MAFYVKVNPKVAEFLKIKNDRWECTDGNYILWMNDMLAFGRLSDIGNIARQIGAAILEPHEAKLEQDGKLCTPLPTAEDERFYVEPEETESIEVQSLDEQTSNISSSDETSSTDEQPTGIKKILRNLFGSKQNEGSSASDTDIDTTKEGGDA